MLLRGISGTSPRSLYLSAVTSNLEPPVSPTAMFMLAALLSVVSFYWRDHIVYPLFDKWLAGHVLRKFNLSSTDDLRDKRAEVENYVYRMTFRGTYARGFGHMGEDEQWKLERAHNSHIEGRHRATAQGIMQSIEQKLEHQCDA
jgi:hypothetical protein